MSGRAILHLYQVDDHGDIRVEKWIEGLVIWVGGRIVYRSWENKNEQNKT